ncbi:MAG: LON peptidase substrate-binding domain-containing protein [Holosporales bacterium]|nr:LON peptidase substrate-binding domain-containing protein [Holosporales bacterium]
MISNEGFCFYILMGDLPTVLPVFKVKSTILMPSSQLPMVISDQDYSVVAQEIVENNVIAIVQSFQSEPSKMFKIGCAGRIMEVSFSEGEISINLYGVCRFEIIDEPPIDATGIERVVVSYDKFLIDINKSFEIQESDNDRLMGALNVYFRNLSISPNWKELKDTPPSILVSALTMAFPFNSSEKQSLLETVSIKDRSDMIAEIMEINAFDRYNTTKMVH